MEYRVMVGTCGEPHRKFMMSIIELMIDFAQNGRKGDLHEMRMAVQKGSILPQLRHRLVRSAQQWGATHLLFADSDQSFPGSLLRQLLSHHLPMVGCNIATKSFPTATTARYKDPFLPTGRIVLPDPSKGTEPVWRLGTGILLVDMKVFLQVPPPWFNVTWKPELDDYEGEDWHFCEKAERYGIVPYVDHGLSETVSHWGEMEYNMGLVLVQEEDSVKKLFDAGIVLPNIGQQQKEVLLAP